MSIYMNYEGIKGDTTQVGHKDWITLSSFAFGLSRTVSPKSPDSKSREGSAPIVNDVNITKTLDKSSALLFQQATMGGKGKKVTIDFCRTSSGVGGKEEVYLQIVLNDTFVSAYSSNSPQGGPTQIITENISLNFSSIEITHNPGDEDNDSSAPIKAGWNSTTQSAI